MILLHTFYKGLGPKGSKQTLELPNCIETLLIDDKMFGLRAGSNGYN